MEPKKTVRVYQNQFKGTPAATQANGKTTEINVKGGSVSSTRYTVNSSPKATSSNNKSTFSYGTPVIRKPAIEEKTDLEKAAASVAIGKSEFYGTPGGLLGIIILQYLICIITLGLGGAWMLCVLEKWRANHTILDGKQLVFEGKAGDIFWRYLGWSFLTVITLGIYGLWMSVKLQAWVTEHTHFED